MQLDDTMRSLLDEFVAESKEHLGSLEEDFLALEQQKDNPDSELVNKVFRAIHTVKGTSGFFGFERITELSHSMENILSLIRSEKMKAESSIIDTLLAGADLISAMIDDVEKSNEFDISGILEKLKAILSDESSEETKEEMASEVELKDKSGNSLDFTIDIFSLKNIGEKQSVLYLLRFDLAEMEKYRKSTPVQLIKYMMSIGDIVDAKIKNLQDDLYSLPKGPLYYNVLFTSKETIPELKRMLNLNDDEIIEVENEFEEHPSSEGKAETVEQVEAAATEKSAEEHVVVPEPEPKQKEEKPVQKAEPKAEQKQEVKESAPKQETKKEEPPEAEKKTTDEKPVETSSMPSTPAPTPKAGGSKSESSGSIRINIDLLDNLMRLASELVLVRNQQLRMIDTSDPAERNMMQRLDIVTSELQEMIMLTRMQPIGNIFSKFQRVVRELARKLNKQISISISGSEVELDKTILESLADPLTHIIRNSCDHGIETPDVREAAGKPAEGHISMNAYHEGGQINIQILDDGKGIDSERVKIKAIEKGLKTETELSQMSEKEILSLIMLAGFSTADQISDVSGRGVGMDVVRSSIEKLGGSIDLESTAGKGTKLHLRLPLTLAIIPCLIVEVGNQRYALPQVNLEELVCLYDDDVRTKIEPAGDREVYRLRDRLLPMVRMNEILKRPKSFSESVRQEITESYRKMQEKNYQEHLQAKREGKANEDVLTQSLNFAVLKVGAGRFGLIVDKVIGTEEIVVKPMHPSLKNLSCYSGATVMGDGSVALILDVEGVARHSGISFDTGTGEISDTKSEHFIDEEKQTILLFENAENERFAVALPLIRRIERIRTNNIEKIGQKEFITVDGVSTRVLRLEKVLNVSPSMQTDQAFLLLPKHIKKPFGILVSRLVDIEETSFELNTESYIQDGLLGTSIIREKMTLFIDIYRLIELSEPDWFDERRKNAPPPDERKQILLVEDNSFFRQLVKGYLEADNYSVITAENGQHALDQLKSHHIDIIISDLEMPVMDGFEFMRNVRADENYAEIPGIALTALDSEDDKLKALEAGYDKYEVKIEREQFLTLLAGMLADQPQENV